ncbi:tocopherol O-methyltransferase [Xylaria bambusicola]|uniref:tocopherol O-methyltransferase n=1 Tax=Xylaria bambusicola TaxID=326684 RepID=UPI002007E161|nr:tocopherol O-methyltransferase [Xylaria bambusicola]KAI0513185.1 tocopherol O-methyltransferase [Xylaria bambusicola]
MATAVETHPGDKHEIPEYEAHESSTSLKERIKKHYEIASDYYYSLWGQHIHHGYFKSPTETKEEAQVNLIKYLLGISSLPQGANVLDVGCGIGGTSRYLAKEHACSITGITISGRQVEIAKKLTQAETSPDSTTRNPTDEVNSYSSGGNCRFLELDAEKMLEHFSADGKPAARFDAVWISEALSHFPDKPLFFRSASELLVPGKSSRLVIADWFKAPQLSPEQEKEDIQPIEDGMLLPPLCTADDYVQMAEKAGLVVRQSPIDISSDVAKTWDISWGLVSSPSLWMFAISQGRDGLAFLQAFRAMRRGYANGTFRYAIMCFEKP